MIEGIEIKRLAKHTDFRGYFMELIRADDDIFSAFGQWSESKMATGVIKAWHIHQIQTDYWRVPVGLVRAVLCDLRPESPTYRQIDEYLLGDDREPIILKIPPGVAHGCKVLQGPALLTYVTSHIYNSDDEGRIAHDDKQIGYDWLTEEIK
jgi:dTDP-4-dehydrorhamnose 3,5-epimerase